MLTPPGALLDSKQALATQLEKMMTTKSEIEFMTGTRALYLLVDQVQQQLVSTQETLSALLEENEALQKENAHLKRWAQEKKSYMLHSLPSGTFVYRLRSLTERAAADYYLCVRCYQDQVTSILQPLEDNFLTCQNCKASIPIRPPLKTSP